MHSRASILVALVAFFGSAGCGGKVSGDPASDSGTSDGSHSGSSSGGSSGSSNGGGPGFGVCPSDAPSPGDVCVTPNQGCIYLSNSGCAAFVCDATSHWVTSSQGC
jgi:hypothetical protein